MVLCLIALPVFAILSIFSVKYRKLTLESLDCVFRTATLRKCRSGLDDRIKSSITGKTMIVSPKAASFVYKYYKLLSWIVLIIFLWSTYTSSVGIYNYAKYGNCNGPQETGFCIFDPTGQNSKTSEVDVYQQSEITYPFLEEDDPLIGNRNASLTIMEFGCYACPYTEKAEPVLKEVLEYYKGKVNIQFKTFYIPRHSMSYKAALASDCALEQGKYQQYHSFVFEHQEELNDSYYQVIGDSIGANTTKFMECINTEKYKDSVNADMIMGLHAGVSGTPTFFINQQEIVGPKPFKTFKAIIDEELSKQK